MLTNLWSNKFVFFSYAMSMLSDMHVLHAVKSLIEKRCYYVITHMEHNCSHNASS